MPSLVLNVTAAPHHFSGQRAQNILTGHLWANSAERSQPLDVVFFVRETPERSHRNYSQQAEQILPVCSAELPNLSKVKSTKINQFAGRKLPGTTRSVTLAEIHFLPQGAALSSVPQPSRERWFTCAVGRAVGHAGVLRALGLLPVPAPGAGTLFSAPRVLPGRSGRMSVRPARERNTGG